MKIYLSHNYAAREWLNEHIKPVLEAAGHEVNSRWLEGKHADRSDKSQKNYAREDLQDVVYSQGILFFCDQFGDRPGKGKFIELGVALTKTMHIWVVGKTNGESVFYHLDQVKRFDTFEEFLHKEILK